MAEKLPDDLRLNVKQTTKFIMENFYQYQKIRTIYNNVKLNKCYALKTLLFCIARLNDDIIAAKIISFIGYIRDIIGIQHIMQIPNTYLLMYL